MDIETKIICNECKKEIPEMIVYVNSEIRIIWDEDEQQYLSYQGYYDLDTVDEFVCPECNKENIIVTEE